MLLLSLIAFGLAGIVSRYLVGSRMPVILFLSVGSIAIISPISLLICLSTSFINFLLLRAAEKKSVFVFSIFLNVLFLYLFHLYPQLNEDLPWAGMVVILGFAYLCLQQIAYLCAVHFKQSKKPDSFLFYATAVLYFPKFFSGPIASLPEIGKQINSPAETRGVAYGLNRVLLGLFKKLVLAGSLEPMVHSVFDFNDAYPGLTLLTGAFLYALQLYFDFSGYSDMAIGISSIWGIRLPENFNFPFRQKSWGDFWKSWHSSLTNWLWQYVFNPLYLFLSRRRFNKILSSLLCAAAVFTAMAFFNGIQPGFYISAGLFAFFYFLETLFARGKSFFSGLLVFCLFSVALIYFRTPNELIYSAITERLIDPTHFMPGNWLREFFAPLASGGTQHDYFNFLTGILLAVLFLLFEKKIYSLFSQDKIRYPAWFVITLLILTWGVFESGERFIYMQF